MVKLNVPYKPYRKLCGSHLEARKTLQKTMKKLFKSKEDPYQAVVALTLAPGPDGNASSSTNFQNGSIWTILPSFNTPNENQYKKLQKSVRKGEKKITELPELKSNNNVRLHDGKTWIIKEKIIKQLKHQAHTLLKLKSETYLYKIRNRSH